MSLQLHKILYLSKGGVKIYHRNLVNKKKKYNLFCDIILKVYITFIKYAGNTSKTIFYTYNYNENIDIYPLPSLINRISPI